jgi:RNA polymerase sigma factor (TIGR02999 family)
VWETIYHNLRRLAHARQGNLPAETLRPTVLVHEAYLKLVAGAGAYESPIHMFRTAGLAMRQILIDYQRNRQTARRGGAIVHKSLDDDSGHSLHQPQLLERLDLEDALIKLEMSERRAHDIFVLRFLAGFSAEEAAVRLGISESTAHRAWVAATLFLAKHLDGYEEAVDG